MQRYALQSFPFKTKVKKTEVVLLNKSSEQIGSSIPTLSLAGQNLRMLNALTTLDTAEMRCLFESVSYFCRIMQQDQTNERQKYGKDEHENLETFSKDL